MPLLFDADYDYLKEIGLEVVEDEASRFLVFKNFPLPEGMYVANGEALSHVQVLYVIPPNYNTEGGDMFWTYPMPTRADGVAIPAVNGPGQDSRVFDGKEFLRWSRHWNNAPWRPKADDIRTIVDRLTWAFANPDAKR
jgi:hypothetical protein